MRIFCDTTKVKEQQPIMAKANYDLIILIIASDDREVYKAAQAVWRTYMHSHPRIKSFFVRGQYDNPAADDLCFPEIKETWEPGILEKTVAAFRHINSHYDYKFVLRTNLSSFFVLDRVLKLLESFPENGLYAGHVVEDFYASGCGFFMSADVVARVVEHAGEMNMSEYDDKEIGYLIQRLGYELISTCLFIFDSPVYDKTDQVYQQQLNIVKHAACIHHVRVKSTGCRLFVDVPVFQDLLRLFYDNIKCK